MYGTLQNGGRGDLGPREPRHIFKEEFELRKAGHYPEICIKRGQSFDALEEEGNSRHKRQHKKRTGSHSKGHLVGHQ